MIYMKLKVGDKVPKFKMYGTDRQPFTNETIKGKKTLLLFIPAAFTSTCTREFCTVRDDISRYNNLSVDVIGISVDSVYSLAKYKEEQQLNFTLASDFNKEVTEAFGISYEMSYGMKGAARRSAFIVDEHGIIQYAEVVEKSGELPDFNAIHAVLEKMDAVKN